MMEASPPPISDGEAKNLRALRKRSVKLRCAGLRPDGSRCQRTASTGETCARHAPGYVAPKRAPRKAALVAVDPRPFAPVYLSPVERPDEDDRADERAGFHALRLYEHTCKAGVCVRLIEAGCSDEPDVRADLLWHADRIDGHAIRAFAALLEWLTAEAGPSLSVRAEAAHREEDVEAELAKLDAAIAENLARFDEPDPASDLPPPPASTTDDDGAERWNTRWLRYAEVHGVDPRSKISPQAFSAWVRARWAEWGAAQVPPRRSYDGRLGESDFFKGDADHPAFDAWLVGRALELRELDLALVEHSEAVLDETPPPATPPPASKRTRKPRAAKPAPVYVEPPRLVGLDLAARHVALAREYSDAEREDWRDQAIEMALVHATTALLAYGLDVEATIPVESAEPRDMPADQAQRPVASGPEGAACAVDACAWCLDPGCSGTACRHISPSDVAAFVEAHPPLEYVSVGFDAPPKNLFGNIEYACLSMDPPWAERGGGKIKRGADRHYDLAGKLGDIRPIVRAIRDSGSFTPAPNAHLWCWYTDTFLEDALALVRELGFRYVRTFVWVKTGGERDDEAVAAARREVLDAAVEAVAEGMMASGRDHHGRTETMSSRFNEALSALSVASRPVEQTDDDLRMGIGQYGRGCHEGLIFAVRGQGQHESVWTGDRAVRSVFHAPHPTDEHGKRIHSRKPPRSYELIERVSKGPRCEFFARIARPGWDVWGNQAPTAEQRLIG